MEGERPGGGFAHVGLEKFQQLFGGANGLCLGVIVGTEFPQRRVELGGEEEHEQAGKEGDLDAIAAKVEVIDVGETEVDGHQGHRDGGEELQHGRAQEGEAQYLHGALAKIFRCIADGLPFRPGAHEKLQGAQPLEAIEEVA